MQDLVSVITDLPSKHRCKFLSLLFSLQCRTWNNILCLFVCLFGLMSFNISCVQKLCNILRYISRLPISSYHIFTIYFRKIRFNISYVPCVFQLLFFGTVIHPKRSVKLFSPRVLRSLPIVTYIVQ